MSTGLKNSNQRYNLKHNVCFFLRDKKISLSIFGVVISKYEPVGHFYKFFKYHPGTYKVHRIQQKQIYHHLLPGERNKR